MIPYIRDYNRSKNKIIDALSEGKVIAYPTDTIFGIGVNAMDERAVNKLYELKNRPEKMPFSILAGNLDLIYELNVFGGKIADFLKCILPGPVTVVLPVKESSAFKSPVLKNDLIGFRIPDHPFCHWLGRHYHNPVITTSANRSGIPPLLNLTDIEKEFQNAISVYIDDPEEGFLHLNKPSTVFKIDVNGTLTILRSGAYPDHILYEHWFLNNPF